MQMIDEEFNPDDSVKTSKVFDLDAGTVDGAPPVDPADIERLNAYQTEDREQRQRDRLDNHLALLGTGLDDLKLLDPLTNTDYEAGPMRDMARQVKEMRQNQLTLIRATRTLIRLNRGLAAEDDG